MICAESDLKYLFNNQYDKFRNMIEKDYHYDSQLQVDVVKNGVICPIIPFFDEQNLYKYKGGVVDHNGKFVHNSGLYKSADHSPRPLTMTQAPDFHEEDVLFLNKTVVYSGLFINHWGHFLFECTTRLWYYLQNDCKQKGIKLAIACVSQKPDANYKEFYELLGIQEQDIIWIDRPTRFDEVIVPEISSILGVYYTPEFLVPFDNIIDKVPAAGKKRVYLTRTQLTPNNTIGEEDIEACFAANGFAVAVPEQMSLRKMIGLLKEAECVAGLSGSNTHNMLFMRPGKKAIVLNRFGEDNNPQELVHKARKMNVTYIDAFSTFLPVTHGGGPFLVSINDNLYHWLSDNGMNTTGYSQLPPQEQVMQFLTEWARINQDDFKSAVLCKLYNMRDCIDTIYRIFGNYTFVAEKKEFNSSIKHVLKKHKWIKRLLP